jgi:acyl-CoA reductase-like NAD-dependent aldehyde dehydrogenase
MAQSEAHGTMVIPETAAGEASTSLANCDVAIADLLEQTKSWLDAAPSDLVELLERLTDSIMAAAGEWVAACCAAKHLSINSPAAGEEWAQVATTARYVRLLAASLTDIAAGRKPQFPGRPHQVAGGYTAIPVFPFDAYDKIALSGFTAQVWLRPGVSVGRAVEDQARAWFNGDEPGVSLVLGAGNQAAIPIVDALGRLFITRHPVIVKMNPVNDYLGPIFERAFHELVERGVLRIVYGGSDVGSYLVRHDGVRDVHVTGSDKTFETIVFGPGEDGANRKAAVEPLIDKPVTGELGSVSPCIVVPGPWSPKDVSFQAQNIASMLTNNAGFNCIALRALITSNRWVQRDALLDGVREVLRDAGPRYPYYPGARDRHDAFLAAHPEAELLGEAGPGGLPWTLIPGLAPAAEDEIAFTTESFTSVFGEVGIDAGGTVDFIRKAVSFANESLWGTLGCTIIVHPKTMEDPEVARAVEQGIADLRYGTVAVNQWSGVGFLLGSTPWGAYPGHSISHVQSGIGFVHNASMLAESDIEKSVVRGPFRMPVKPNWFVTNKTSQRSGELFARLMAKPSWSRLPGLVTTALRG